MRGLKAFFAKRRAQLYTWSLEQVAMLVFAFFIVFVIFAMLFLIACSIGALVSALAFFFCWMVAGVWMVLGIAVAEAKMNTPVRFEYIGEHRKAVGREFRI